MMKLSSMIILKRIVSRNLIPIGNINGTSYLVIDKNKKIYSLSDGSVILLSYFPNSMKTFRKSAT